MIAFDKEQNEEYEEFLTDNPRIKKIFLAWELEKYPELRRFYDVI